LLSATFRLKEHTATNEGEACRKKVPALRIALTVDEATVPGLLESTEPVVEGDCFRGNSFRCRGCVGRRLDARLPFRCHHVARQSYRAFCLGFQPIATR
jgi:hypothetical protein